MRLTNILLAPVLAVFVGSSQAAAQSTATAVEEAPAASVDSLNAVLRAAEQYRSYLRLTMTSQSMYSGYVFRVEPDSQWVHIGARRAMLPAIERVELRHKEGSVALIGAIIGAAALGSYTVTRDREDCSIPCGSWLVRSGALVVGGILGALFGIMIDPGATTWEEVWAAE